MWENIVATDSFLHGDYVACPSVHGAGVAAEDESSLPPTRM